MTPFFIPSGLPQTVRSSKITGLNVWVWPFWPLSPGTLPFRSKIYLLKRSKIAETNEMVFTFWLWPSLRLSKAALLVLSLHFRLLTTPFLSHQKWSRKLLIALLLEISVVMSDPCKHSIIDIASPLPKNQFLVPTLWTHVKTLPRQTIMRHVFSCFVLARRPFLPHGIRNGCVFRLLYLRPGGGTKATTRTLLMLYQRLRNRKGKLINWWRWWWVGLNLIIMLMMIWWRWRRWRPRQQWWEKNDHGEGEDKNVESKLVPAPKLADDGAGADDKCWKCLVGGGDNPWMRWRSAGIAFWHRKRQWANACGQATVLSRVRQRWNQMIFTWRFALQPPSLLKQPGGCRSGKWWTVTRSDQRMRSLSAGIVF